MVRLHTPMFRLAVLLAALTIGSCSDDNPTVPADTTPPTVAAVTPVDEFHLDVGFSEEMSKSSAEDETNYLLTESTTLVSDSGLLTTGPGDTLRVAAIVLKPDGKTISIGTETSMAGKSLSLSMTGVSDASGNPISPQSEETFTGSSDPDVTPPTILSRSPAPNSINVGLTTAVIVQFSEAMQYVSFDYYSNMGGANFSAQVDGATYTLTLNQPLAYNTVYTLQVESSQDYAANSMSSEPWRFTTIKSTDTTKPTIVSTAPSDLETNVELGATISITFSEPVNQSFFNVDITPYPFRGVATTWSSDGKTVSLDPFDPLPADQQHALAIEPGQVVDLVGNYIEGVHVVRFTTGEALESGSIRGALEGDPFSEAADPTGATVVAGSSSTFNQSHGPDILGSAIVAANDTYLISNLGDGKYFPLASLDTNGDGYFDPRAGDAIGAYGIDFDALDFEPDSVLIAGGNQAVGVNFPLYDPSAITGTVTYEGMHASEFGYLFAAIFDPLTYTVLDPGEPVATSEWNRPGTWPGHPSWNVNSFVQPIPPGNYYVGVYLDADDNRTYDPATDPVGFYGGSAPPTPVHVANGNEISGIVIHLVDPPVTASSSISRAWRAPASNASLERLCDALGRVQFATKK